MFKEAKFIYGLSCIEEPPAGEISGIGKLHKCLSDASYLKANKQVVLQYTKVSVSITNYMVSEVKTFNKKEDKKGTQWPKDFADQTH